MDRSELVKALEEIDHIQEVLDSFPVEHFPSWPDNPIKILRHRINVLLRQIDQEAMLKWEKLLRG